MSDVAHAIAATLIDQGVDPGDPHRVARLLREARPDLQLAHVEAGIRIWLHETTGAEPSEDLCEL